MRSQNTNIQNSNRQKLINIKDKKIEEFEIKISEYIKNFKILSDPKTNKNEFDRRARILLGYYQDLKEFDIFEESNKLNIGMIKLNDILLKKSCRL